MAAEAMYLFIAMPVPTKLYVEYNVKEVIHSRFFTVIVYRFNVDKM